MNEGKHFLFKDKNSETHLWNKIQLFREEECMVDVTLACGGKLYTAHKLVLSACSDYFKEIFSNINNHFPIVFLRDVSCIVLEALLEFIYVGEVNVSEYDISAFMKTAEELKVRGLSASNTRTFLKSYRAKSVKRAYESKVNQENYPSKKQKYIDNDKHTEDNSENESSDLEQDSDVNEELGINFTDLLTNEAGVPSAELSTQQPLSIKDSSLNTEAKNDENIHSGARSENELILHSRSKLAHPHDIENSNEIKFHKRPSNMKKENLINIKEEPVYMTVDTDGEHELMYKVKNTSSSVSGTDLEELMRNSTTLGEMDRPTSSSIKEKNTVCTPVSNYVGSQKCLQTKFKNYHSLLEVDLTHPMLEVDLTTPEETDHPDIASQEYVSSHIHSLNQNPIPEKYQYLDLIEELRNNPTLSSFLSGTLEDILDRPSLQSVFRDIVIDYLDRNNYIRNGSSCSIRWQYSLLGKTIYEAFPNVMWEKGEITCKKSKAERKDRKRPVNAWTLMMHKVATVRKERKRIAKKRYTMSMQPPMQGLTQNSTTSSMCQQMRQISQI